MDDLRAKVAETRKTLGDDVTIAVRLGDVTIAVRLGDLEALLETEDVARRFVAAANAIEQSPAGQGSLLDAICDRDLAYHDLIVVLGEPCDCEPGTCPGAPAASEDVEIAGEVL